jgi:hypothetical protein
MEFEVTPAHAARSEYFQLLIEGKNWLPDTILRFPMPEPPPLEILGQQPNVDANGLAFDLDINTAGGVPWVAATDADWIMFSQSAGSGSTTVGVTVLPNWEFGARTGRIEVGGVQAPIAQSGCNHAADRIVLLCYWKLLRRIPTTDEVEFWRRRENVAPELIEELLGGKYGSNSLLLTERLFTSFLDQTPRPGRWRGVIRQANDDVQPAEIIRRFLTLTEVRELFTPTGSSELLS